MNEIFSRNELYWGEAFQKNLASKNICILGLGGVGGYTAEMLVRAGIHNLTLVDFDTVSTSNINRQIIALQSTVGQKKTALFEKRLKDINPNINLKLVDDFYSENLKLDFTEFDYVVDAIDSLRSKIHLLETCYKLNVPIISSMGAGNRIDPTQLYICDISEIENKNAPFVSNIIYQLKKEKLKKGLRLLQVEKNLFLKKKSMNLNK